MATGAPKPIPAVIRTPDQRLRVFISSTLGELAPERLAIKAAIERLHLTPVMFEDGARPHAPRTLYRAYLAQSHIFVGIYWQRYGWIGEGESVSGLEDEYRLAGDRPRLLYIKHPAAEREPRLTELLRQFQADDKASYKRFGSTEELVSLVERDLVLLLSERFEAAAAHPDAPAPRPRPPQPLTRTFGRENEIRAVQDYLRAGTRLLTLSGPGGVGKTRLAQAAVGALEEAYPDGICFVPLQTVTQASLVARVVVDQLGIRTEGTWSPEDALASHLAGRRVLIVLDNLEQIAGVQPVIRQMLERSPGLQVLATSRRALRLGGEQEFPVPPLPLPGEEGGTTMEPAVELFLDRARAVDPRFAPDAAGLAAIAEICRRLDGLPLAIELAAARIRLLAPQDILQRLSSGLDLLSTRSADLPARQQTLRATLDWSYELLSAGERSLLARLSAFEGSFSLEAATIVCGDGSLDVVEDLTGLLDSSLILPSEDPAYLEPRFRMLQTVRSYAADRLAHSGEADAVHTRYVAWLLDLSERAAPFLCGPHQRDWAARFDAERANLRAVIRTALGAGDFDSAVKLIWNTLVFFEIRDANAEPQAWVREIIAKKQTLSPQNQARLRLADVMFRAAGRDLEGADAALAAARAVFAAHALRLELAVTMMVWSDVHLHLRNDLAAARAALQESKRLFASLDHDWGVARTQIMMSLLHWMDGKAEQARACLGDALVHSRRIENEPQIARALCLLAMIDPGAECADPQLLRDAAEIVVRGRYRTEAAACLEALALSSHQAGREAEAQEAVSLSNRLRRQLQLWPPPPVIGALSAAGLLAPRPDPADKPQADATFAFLAERLLAPQAGAARPTG